MIHALKHCSDEQCSVLPRRLNTRISFLKGSTRLTNEKERGNSCAFRVSVFFLVILIETSPLTFDWFNSTMSTLDWLLHNNTYTTVCV